MARLVLLGGPPGSGKSTVAARLAAELPRTVAVDVDVIKHGLDSWAPDPAAAGLEARDVALRRCRELLRAGMNVVVAQYLARTTFIEALAVLAADEAVGFVEIVLVLDADTLAARLGSRAERPDRREHVVNNVLVGPEAAGDLVAALDSVLAARPWTHRVFAGGSLDQTVAAVRGVVSP